MQILRTSKEKLVTDPNSKYVVGVDLGGTKILAGVFDENLNCLGSVKKSTKADRGQKEVVKRIARCVIEAVDECDLKPAQIAGVGIGAPGSIDPKKGIVLFAPNLKWKNYPLAEELKKRLKVDVFLENDCNVCALGAYHGELDGQPESMVGIFLGTGIGGGIILNRELHRGFNKTAGEVGHMVIDMHGPICSCGRNGCFEAIAGRASIYKHIHSAVQKGRETVLTTLLGKDLKGLKSGSLKKAMKRRDPLVSEVLNRAAEATGIAVANLINVINPEVVLLGGGVMEALERDLMPTIIQNAERYSMPGAIDGIQIIASTLGDDAGIYGSAVLAWMQLNGDGKLQPINKSQAVLATV